MLLMAGVTDLSWCQVNIKGGEMSSSTYKSAPENAFICILDMNSDMSWHINSAFSNQWMSSDLLKQQEILNAIVYI